MKNYRLLSDAILDGAKLRRQGYDRCVDMEGRTCALGAAIHAIDGEPSEAYHLIHEAFPRLAQAFSKCPDMLCRDTNLTIVDLVPHLNDFHRWTREQIAAFVSTIEEKLGLVEVLTETSTNSVTEGSPISEVPVIAGNYS